MQFTEQKEDHTQEIRVLLVYRGSLFTGSFDAKVRKWDILTKKKIWESKADGLVFSLTAHKNIIYSCDHKIIGWDFKTGNLISKSKFEENTIYSIAIYEDNLYAGLENQIINYSIQNDKIRKNKFLKIEIKCWSLDVSENYIVCGTSSGSIAILDRKNLKLINTINPHLFGVWTVAIWKDFFYSGSNDGFVKKHSFKDQKFVETIHKFNKEVTNVLILEESGIGIICDDKGNIIVFDLYSNECLESFQIDFQVWFFCSDGLEIYFGGPEKKILYKSIHDFANKLSFVNDFQKLFEREEFCDSKIICLDGEFKVHSIIIETRLGKKMEEIKNNFLDKTKAQMRSFLEWIYTGFTNQKEEAFEIFKEISEYSFFELSGKPGIVESFSKLYEQEESKDFVIIVDQEMIHVHKIILAARCDLYRGMFLSVVDNSNKVSDYSGKSITAIKTLIKFLYTDKIEENISLHVIEEMKDIPDYFVLDTLSNFGSQLDYIEKKKKF
ncbi:lissencephaly-1 [Anaeramoeba ignava]|uniref:Lissencephaly-1 n=1 Tax=Anaeramoeba ignava TaxID=1746090 RepID=A0A9Q0LXN7_ANAIG|nr:lissencephaly-1 [Anaeramoeba ignava]